jgi:predicted Zn-dependent protease
MPFNGFNEEVAMNGITCPRSLVVFGMLATALAPVLLGGCATTGINRGQLNIITSPEEVKMGKEMSVEVAKQYDVYDSAAITAYVQGVGNKVVQGCDRRDIDYHFAVIKKDEINAFALPGGYIYVYTGLMKDIDDESQLAAVIAHEVAHVTARHATERLTTMYGYQFLAGLVLGENPNGYAKLVADMVSTGGFLRYSRMNEYEADQLGAKYLYAAGYDPSGMIELMGMLKKMETSEPSQLEVWLATHPPTRERLSKVEAEIAGFPKLPSPVRNATGYARIKAQLPK